MGEWEWAGRWWNRCWSWVIVGRQEMSICRDDLNAMRQYVRCIHRSVFLAISSARASRVTFASSTSR